MDLIEIDAASNTGVDNIRDLLEKVGFRPTQATYKVYVIDEVHMLSTAAFNALLKTLEEPPEHVIFVLATTEVHKIPETILSRCQRFEFRRIPLDAIVERLGRIAEAEEVEAEPEALELISRAATGSMRDAISLFDQLAAGGSITGDYVRLMLGAERREVVRALLEAWVSQDLTAGLNIINGAVDGGADPRQLARQTADFLRGLLLTRLGAGQTWTDPTAAERAAFAEIAAQADPDDLVEAVRLFSEVASKQRTGWQPQLPLELAFVEAAIGQQRHIGMPSQTTKTGTSASQASDATGAAAYEARAQAKTRDRASPASSRSRAPAKTSEKADEQPQTTGTQSSEDREARVSQATSEQVPSPGKTEPASSDDDRPDEAARGLDSSVVSSLTANWQDLIRRIEPVTLGALLRDASVGGGDDQGRLVLAFQHTFHRKRVAEDDNLRKVEEVLSQYTNQSIVVRCVLAEEWQKPNPKPAKPTAKGKALTLAEDELIRRAQEELGAVAKIND
jgi:DNA polymerase-3 subunit gamma/tau